jgi:hypothetical protein
MLAPNAHFFHFIFPTFIPSQSSLDAAKRNQGMAAALSGLQ